MKKILFILILASVLLINPVKAVEILRIDSGYIVTDAVVLKVTLVNQDPYPAEPGGYVDLLFKLENRGTETAENVSVELLPEYPFSLDPGVNATKDLGAIKGWQIDNQAFLIKYRVRVDKDAVNGENEIKLKYTYGTGAAFSTMSFNVTISNPRTDFDVVVQDSTATSTTLAIVNIGSNTAYSVIVRIPEQPNFRVIGSSASVIGNLDAGDYTLVTFQIERFNLNASAIPRTRNFTQENPVNISASRNLIVEISYTDKLGIRRTIQKNVELGMETITNITQFAQRRYQQQTPSSLTYILIGVLGIVLIVGLIVFFKRGIRKKK